MSAQPLVARQSELARLEGFLTKALASEGQICFVLGQAGSGKSSLLIEFAELAQATHQELVVAMGLCDAQTGSGDPYLPFREVLNLLIGETEGKLAQGKITSENAARLQKLFILCGETLVEFGPDLIGMLVPGAVLMGKVGKFLSGKTRWSEKLRQRLEHKPSAQPIEQNQIYEQYVNVLRKLSEQTPLLLVLDDLQWADPASLGLLFRLARRLEGARIMVVGLYRPNDVALGRGGERHPLEAILSEIKRYHGDIELDLDSITGEQSRAFVEAYLDLEPNRLDEAFRDALYKHTGGHPLFTVELLRNLQERGDLLQDAEGRWIESEQLDWNQLPSRIEGIIEERIGRLADDLKQSLTIASVEGEQFTAEVVAQVQSTDLRRLVHGLSEALQNQHRLVRSEGVERLSGQRISRYRFSHNLMQHYLYRHLDKVQVSFLHEDVGKALEALYGQQAERIAVQLARHFDLAEMPDQARRYLQKAGEQSAAQYANTEAVRYFSRALEFTPEDDLEARYTMLSAREKVYSLQGARSTQAEDLQTLRVLAQRLNDPQRQAQVALRQADYAIEAGEYAAASTFVQEVLASSRPAEALATEAQLAWGRILYLQADYAGAKPHLEQALSWARAAQLTGLEALCLTNLGIVNDLGGERDLARSCFEQALTAHRQTGNRRMEGRALSNLGVSYWRVGDFKQATDYFEQGLQIDQEVGDRPSEGKSLANLALVLNSQGQYGPARSYAEQALVVNQELESPYAIVRTMGILASIVLAQGDYMTARAANQEALALDRQVGDRQDEAYRLENLGLIAAQLGQYPEAERCYSEGLALAREIGDRAVELNCLRGQTALLYLQGDLPAARACGEQALHLAKELNDPAQGLAWTWMGHVQAALGEADLAQQSYQQACALLGEKALEARAGLARVALAQGDAATAITHLGPVLELALSTNFDGLDERFRVYLTCYQVLRAVSDARAHAVLRKGRSLLQELAEKIGDPDIQRSFLENIPWHSELLGTA